MIISDYKVFITRNGDGAISYQCGNTNYKVFIKKEHQTVFNIFLKHYLRLETFKHRHYAIAQSIARDIRAKGYSFKAYANNSHNIRPVLLSKTKRLTPGEEFENKIIKNIHRIRTNKKRSKSKTVKQFK